MKPILLPVLIVMGLTLSIASGEEDGLPVGAKLDTNADGVWDHTYLGDGVWDPPITSMPPPGTLMDNDADSVADAVLVDQNGNGVVDGIDIGMDGTVDIEFSEGDGGGGGGGGEGEEDGLPVGAKLDTNADGVWDHTYLGDGVWDPPITSMPPPGTLMDNDADSVADAVLVDQNGNGVVDGLDIGMDGTVDIEFSEGDGGGGGGGGGEGGEGPPVGTKLDTNADGVWDHTYLGDGVWDPPITGMPPPGTLIDMNGDSVAEAVLVDQNNNGVVDGLDMGMDGTVDVQFSEGDGGGGGGGGGGGEGEEGPPVGTKLDTNADGVWDHTYLGDGAWDPPITGMPPPGTLVDFTGDNVADGVMVDQNNNGVVDGLDVGMDGTVDIQFYEG